MMGRTFHTAGEVPGWVVPTALTVLIAGVAGSAFCVLLAVGPGGGSAPWGLGVLSTAAGLAGAALIAGIGGRLGRERVVVVDAGGLIVDGVITPAASIPSIRLVGAPGAPIEAWAGSVLLFALRDTDQQRYARFDVRALRAKTGAAAERLGVPLIDELPPDPVWDAAYAAALARRRASRAEELRRNRDAHPALHASVPVEPPTTWTPDGVVVSVPVATEDLLGGSQQGRLSLVRDHLVFGDARVALGSIDRVCLFVHDSEAQLFGAVRIEVDGLTRTVLKVRLGTTLGLRAGEAQAGHLVWVVRQIEAAAARARDVGPPVEASVPDALVRLAGAARRAPER